MTQPQAQPPRPKPEKKPEATGIPSVDQPVPVEQLSPEEQMARFEQELKDKDWGHQPC
jgi:hypothetical protein